MSEVARHTLPLGGHRSSMWRPQVAQVPFPRPLGGHHSVRTTSGPGTSGSHAVACRPGVSTRDAVCTLHRWGQHTQAPDHRHAQHTPGHCEQASAPTCTPRTSHTVPCAHTSRCLHAPCTLQLSSNQRLGPGLPESGSPSLPNRTNRLGHRDYKHTEGGGRGTVISSGAGPRGACHPYPRCPGPQKLDPRSRCWAPYWVWACVQGPGERSLPGMHLRAQPVLSPLCPAPLTTSWSSEKGWIWREGSGRDVVLGGQGDAGLGQRDLASASHPLRHGSFGPCSLLRVEPGGC